MLTERRHASLSIEPFGRLDGADVHLLTLRNRAGMTVRISDFGGIITAIEWPQTWGVLQAVLGFDTLAEYLATDYQAAYPYLGALIGRHAGRIRHGMLADTTIQLGRNHHGHHLHGGYRGFDRVLWQISATETGDEPSVSLSHVSPDGTEGYPGELAVTVLYRLGADNSLSLDYRAETDRRTWVNLTQHSYFNLAGATEDVSRHVLQIGAEHYLPSDAELLPLGTLAAVAESEWDFRQPRRIGTQVLDKSWVLSAPAQASVPAASLWLPENDVHLTVYTDQPVLHVYNGQHLPRLAPPARKPIAPFMGICLETQGFNDAPNHAAFPSTCLDAGKVYRQHTRFQFGHGPGFQAA